MIKNGEFLVLYVLLNLDAAWQLVALAVFNGRTIR